MVASHGRKTEGRGQEPLAAGPNTLRRPSPPPKLKGDTPMHNVFYVIGVVVVVLVVLSLLGIV
jgi:hypothetical protein